MMTIDQDVVLMIEKIVTINQEEMAISNLEDVLTIKKMETSNQDAALMMISQEEEMVTLSLDVVLMMISLDADSMMINQDVVLMIEKTVTLNQEDVLMMINQIVDTGNKTLRDFS